MARTKAAATEARNKAIDKLVFNLIGNKCIINKLNCIEIIRKFSGIARARKITAKDLWNAITFLKECQEELKEKHPPKLNESGDDDESNFEGDANSESDDDDYVDARPKKQKTKGKTKSTAKLHDAETAAIQCTVLAPKKLQQDAHQTYDQTHAHEQLHEFVNGHVASLDRRAAHELFENPPRVHLKGSTDTNPISNTDVRVDEPASTLAYKLVYADIRSEAVFCIWVSKMGRTITGVRPLDCIQFG